jgi:hypothetical protein
MFWSAFLLLASDLNPFTFVLFAGTFVFILWDAEKKDLEFEATLAVFVSGLFLFLLFVFAAVFLYGGKPEPKRRLPPPPPAYCKVLVHVDAGISSKEPGWCSWSDVASLSEGLNKASGRVMIIAHGRRENHYVVGEGWTPPQWVVGGVDARVLSESAEFRGLEIGVMACRGEKNPTGLNRLRIHPIWEEDLGVWVWAREGEKVLVDEGTLEKSVQFFFRDY